MRLGLLNLQENTPNPCVRKPRAPRRGGKRAVACTAARVLSRSMGMNCGKEGEGRTKERERGRRRGRVERIGILQFRFLLDVGRMLDILLIFRVHDTWSVNSE